MKIRIWKRWWENIAKDRKVIPDPIDERRSPRRRWKWRTRNQIKMKERESKRLILWRKERFFDKFSIFIKK